MPQNTDLNVAPYYDDFDKDDNFVRTLFRPGFAIQARELTQLQSTLQNQIEQGFSHMFKDGTVVIPGASSYQGNNKAARYVRLQSSLVVNRLTILNMLMLKILLLLQGQPVALNLWLLIRLLQQQQIL